MLDHCRGPHVHDSPLHLSNEPPSSAHHTQASSKDSSPASSAASLPGGPPPFLSLAYGYMPLVWGATLAHYLPMALTEVGRALPVRPAQAPGTCDDCVARAAGRWSFGETLPTALAYYLAPRGQWPILLSMSAAWPADYGSDRGH